MTKQTTEIEVEVVEIDGVVAMPAQARPNVQNANWKDWKQWQGRIPKLDDRWWPLWAFLGVILLGFLLSIGLVVALVLLILRTFLLITRWIRG